MPPKDNAYSIVTHIIYNNAISPGLATMAKANTIVLLRRCRP